MEDSIKLYNEGTTLAAQCKEQLQGIEKKLEIINEG